MTDVLGFQHAYPRSGYGGSPLQFYRELILGGGARRGAVWTFRPKRAAGAVHCRETSSLRRVDSLPDMSTEAEVVLMDTPDEVTMEQLRTRLMESQIAIIEALRRANVSWTIIERATGIDEISFNLLKQSLAAPDDRAEAV